MVRRSAGHHLLAIDRPMLTPSTKKVGGFLFVYRAVRSVTAAGAIRSTTAQTCVSGGRVVVVLQLLASAQVRLCELLTQVLHAPQVQLSTQELPEVQAWVKAGRVAVVPQAFASVQVRDCLLFTQLDQVPHDQLSVQLTVQLWVSGGRLVVVPQAFASVQLRLCDPFVQVDQAPQLQVSVHELPPYGRAPRSLPDDPVPRAGEVLWR